MAKGQKNSRFWYAYFSRAIVLETSFIKMDYADFSNCGKK
jgi:hypothetical protein